MSKKCKSKSITVKQRHVKSTSEKHLNKILDMLQVVNNETQSLVLILIGFTSSLGILLLILSIFLLGKVF